MERGIKGVRKEKAPDEAGALSRNRNEN